MSMERGVRARLTTALVLFLVLAAGGVLGVAVDRRLEATGVPSESDREGPTARSGPERARGPDDRSRDSARRRSLIVEQVGLSDEQKTRVDSIVGYYRGRMQALHEEFDATYMSRYTEILESTRNDIRGVLSEAQRAAYDSLLADRDQRTEQRRRDSIGDGGEDRNER